MDRGRQGREESIESEDVVRLAPTYDYRQRFSRYEPYSQRSSMVDDMPSVPESSAARSRSRGNARTNMPRLPVPNHYVEQPSSTSLLRSLTKRLSSAKILAPRLSSSTIPLSNMTSLRHPRGTGYMNLRDNGEEDTNQAEENPIPVDLSLLSGLGFEFKESKQRPEEPGLNQDTAYRSSRNESPAPPFQEFLNRRKVGDGLVVGAKISRDPSFTENDLANTRAQQVQRKRTLRKAAQNIAEQKNMIISVSEPVDLSFLEGRVATQRTFDTILHRTGTVDDTPLSYFFPHDPVVPSWRPLTMSTPYIVFLTASAFALAGCQEYLCQKSQALVREQKGLLTFDSVDDVSVGVFFVWKYLPTMITIIYAVMFSVMDFDIRRLEPFYQLSQPRGSPASESLNVDHLTTFQYFVPFKAFRLKQWTVFFSTIANIIASTVSPALQNPSVDFNPNSACSQPDGTTRCPSDDIKLYVVVITPVWSRLLSASYVVVGIICIILFIQLRRKTGLQEDPKGIAGIASMATKSHILREFKDTDLYTQQQLQNHLAHRRFILYKSSIWQGQWNADKDNRPPIESRLSSPHPPMLRLTAGYPFIAAQVFCLVAVPLISLTKANVIPNTVPWLPILVATILKLVWSTFEADVRLMEPFYQLSLGNAAPEASLTLDYQSTIYGLLPFKAAYNGHWLLCVVGLCSVALDVLSVTVSSFSIQADILYTQVTNDHHDGGPAGPNSEGDESKVSFWTSVILSLAILALVIFTTVLVYIRRRHPFLPREPSTIASILAFIYASKMLEDFIDTEKFSNKQMEKRLKSIGKRYALGWFIGRDNQIHCAIDQEPIQSKYVHGKPYGQATLFSGPVDIHGGFYP